MGFGVEMAKRKASSPTEASEAPQERRVLRPKRVVAAPQEVQDKRPKRSRAPKEAVAVKDASVRSVLAKTEVTEREIYRLVQRIDDLRIHSPIPLPALPPIRRKVHTVERIQKLLAAMHRKVGQPVQAVLKWTTVVDALHTLLADNSGVAKDVMRGFRTIGIDRATLNEVVQLSLPTDMMATYDACKRRILELYQTEMAEWQTLYNKQLMHRVENVNRANGSATRPSSRTKYLYYVDYFDARIEHLEAIMKSLQDEQQSFLEMIDRDYEGMNAGPGMEMDTTTRRSGRRGAAKSTHGRYNVSIAMSTAALVKDSVKPHLKALFEKLNASKASKATTNKDLDELSAWMESFKM